MSASKRINGWRLALLVLAVSLIPRLYLLGEAAIYSDEITWMVRGKEVVYGLLHRNWNYFDNAWWNKQNDTEAIGLPLVATSGVSYVLLAENGGRISLKLLPEILAARLPVAIVNSFLPVALFVFGSYFFGVGVGLLAAILYSINPLVLGVDRFLVHDSFLTLFSFLGLVTFLWYGKERKNSFWPGIFLALAFLTKPNGILPSLGWLVFFGLNLQSKPILKLLVTNILVFLLVITLFWPASWSSPGLAFFEYLYRQTTLVSEGMRNFYWGEITNNPGPTYFIFQLVSKLPEAVILALVMAVYFGIKEYKRLRSAKNFEVFLAILAYWLAFFALITLSPKKLGARYAMPLVPWLVLAASFGLLKIFDQIRSKQLKKIWIGAVVISLIYPLSFAPDYYQYYNQFVGGPKGAQSYDLVGFCASSKPAFEYLNKTDFKGKVYIAGCSDPVAYYSPQIEVVRDYKLSDVVVVETYLRNQHPEDPVWEYLSDRTPEKQFKTKNATIAELYIIQ